LEKLTANSDPWSRESTTPIGLRILAAAAAARRLDLVCLLGVIGAVPQPTDKTRCGSRLLAEARRKNSAAAINAAGKTLPSPTFSTPTPDSDSCR